MIMGFGIWAVQSSTTTIHAATEQYAKGILQTFVSQDIEHRHVLLKLNSLDTISSFREAYQKEATLTARHISLIWPGHIFGFTTQGKLVFDTADTAPEVMKKRWASELNNIRIHNLKKAEGHIENEMYVAMLFEPWGWIVFVSLDDDEIHMASTRIRNAAIGVALIASLLTLILLHILFKIFIVSPVKLLKEATAAIARQDYTNTMGIDTNDELGELSRDIDRMSQEIASNQLRLLHWTEELEKNVHKRTKELNWKNKELSQEIILREQVEATLRHYSDELQRSNEEIQRFSYIVSHDLRAPLVNLKGFVKELHFSMEDLETATADMKTLLAEDKQKLYYRAMNEDIPEALGFIDTSVTRMDRLINAILNLSRLGRRELKLEWLDMNELVRETFHTLAHDIEQKNIRVTVDDMPEIWGDRLSMEQIFGNIIGNAIKYLDPDRPGNIHVFCDRETRAAVFHIQDNGRGINPNETDMVFEPFRRLGKQDVLGEGMGMAYVKKLIKLLGGRIWLESEPDKGTTVSFRVPDKSDAGEHA